MKRCMPMLAVMALCAGLAARAQTVDEIIAKSLAARGGADRIRAIQTQRLTGHIWLGPDAEGSLQVEIKRPGKIREEVTLNGVTRIRTLDGTSGWYAGGTDEPRPLSADELKNLAGSADIDGPLLDYRARGSQVELVGKEAVEGKDAYKLRVTLKDGRVRYAYIDCVSYLGVKWEGTIQANGREVQVESFFHDYRPVDGVMYAFAIDSDSVGSERKQKLVFDKIEVNPAEDDARFGKPVVAATGGKAAP
jgi:hypothetical protein